MLLLLESDTSLSLQRVAPESRLPTAGRFKIKAKPSKICCS